jgi:hypothetical protein
VLICWVLCPTVQSKPPTKPKDKRSSLNNGFHVLGLWVIHFLVFRYGDYIESNKETPVINWHTRFFVRKLISLQYVSHSAAQNNSSFAQLLRCNAIFWGFVSEFLATLFYSRSVVWEHKGRTVLQDAESLSVIYNINVKMKFALQEISPWFSKTFAA